MTYRVSRAVAHTSTRSFILTHAVGRATSARGYRVTHVVGRAAGLGPSSGTWKVTRVRGRARVGAAPSGPVAEPFDVVQLADGAWVQTGGPPVVISPGGAFVAPALPGGTDLTFQFETLSVTIHVNPHTVFGTKATFPDPLYVSPHPEPLPAATLPAAT